MGVGGNDKVEIAKLENKKFKVKLSSTKSGISPSFLQSGLVTSKVKVLIIQFVILKAACCISINA